MISHFAFCVAFAFSSAFSKSCLQLQIAALATSFHQFNISSFVANQVLR
jgi:hypothetical protein